MTGRSRECDSDDACESQAADWCIAPRCWEAGRKESRRVRKLKSREKRAVHPFPDKLITFCPGHRRTSRQQSVTAITTNTMSATQMAGPMGMRPSLARFVVQIRMG